MKSRQQHVMTNDEVARQDGAFSLWVTKEQAAERLNVSVRSIERRIADGQLRTMKRPRRGQHPETMIHPDDFARLEAEARTTEIVTPPATQTAALATLSEQVPDLITQLARAIRPEPTPQNLTLKAAAEYTGLPKGLLLRAIREGRLAAHKWRDAYFIHRDDLDAFRPERAAKLAWSHASAQ